MWFAAVGSWLQRAAGPAAPGICGCVEDVQVVVAGVAGEVAGALAGVGLLSGPAWAAAHVDEPAGSLSWLSAKWKVSWCWRRETKAVMNCSYLPILVSPQSEFLWW